ncbi:ROK family protein [Glycomyces sp. A-F 0318]|uniref:ROK family protein n=1 Tax=Glycomyces amatae TaxID=2881355 RepID=UPI001E33C6EA|nr:ROK family protein [Glycomyces amatae]MCD0445069.1 ROK family protein [Glycomyces amatae]
MTVALAIDLGGTKVEAALVRGDGRVLEHTRTRAATGAGAAADRAVGEAAIAAAVRGCMEAPEWREVSAAGIGSAGPVDLAKGTIAPINLPSLRDFAIAAFVRGLTGLEEVAFRLDGTCIALAESWLGAARGVRNVLVLVVSTGVGGGVIADGRLLSGAGGNAGHLGQLVVERVEGPVEAATVEGIAAGPRTTAWARSRGWRGETGEDLARSYRDGDPVAVAAVGRSARAVGLGLVNASTLLDLELAVIGGGFAAVAEDYPDLVAAAIKEHAVNAYAAEIAVVRAGLGGDAPLIGAAALVHRADLLG